LTLRSLTRVENSWTLSLGPFRNFWVEHDFEVSSAHQSSQPSASVYMGQLWTRSRSRSIVSSATSGSPLLETSEFQHSGNSVFTKGFSETGKSTGWMATQSLITTATQVLGWNSSIHIARAFYQILLPALILPRGGLPPGRISAPTSLNGGNRQQRFLNLCREQHCRGLNELQTHRAARSARTSANDPK
jgi:hypothetical protein